MDSQLVISVLLTAHNCEKFISDTLGSLKKACNGIEKSIEFILVNDSSSDNTSQILHNFAVGCPHASVYDVNFKNVGRVRNFGISKCQGKYITMLDGDDQLLSNAFVDIIDCLVKNEPDLLLLSLNEIHPNQKETPIWKGLNPLTLTQSQTIEKFLIHKEIQAHFIGQFIRKDLLDNNPFPEFICYEDAYLFPTIVKKSNNILFNRQSPYLYFKRENSLSNKLNDTKISLLVKATQQMDDVLGNQYRNLLTCHWINIAYKFSSFIHDKNDNQLIESAINKSNFLSFVMDRKVRTSFKKKLIKLKLKSKKKAP